MKNIIKKIKHLGVFDIVFIALAVTSIVFFAYVFFRKSTYITVNIKVGEENIRYEPWIIDTGTRVWFAQLFYEGMKETDGLGRIMAEVTTIRSYDTEPARKALYLTTKLKAVYNRASNQYTFKGRPLVIGSTIKLNLDRFFVEGLVVHVEGVVDPREKVTLLVNAQIKDETVVFPETSGTDEYVANALKINEEIKDSQGKTIIKILDKRVEDAKRLVTTDDGRVLIQTNPLKKDVFLTLEVSAIKIGHQYYLFDDVPILIDEEIPINTTSISIFPVVTKFTLVE